MKNTDTRWADAAWDDILQKVKQTSAVIGSDFPAMSKDGEYICSKRLADWTTGFWPGILWLLYNESGDQSFRDIAEACEAKLDPVLEEYTDLGHDIGFVWQLSSINNFKVSGSNESRRRALTAASHLAGRFNINGRFLQAWNKNDVNQANPQGLSIIDSMMNLPILFFAAKELNAPRFEHVAKAHAATVLREFINADGSVKHMVEFCPFTGSRLRVHGGQGFSEESSWSRGASWAIHGMAKMHSMTGDEIYLETAKKVADFFIAHSLEDHVAPWDFRVELTEETPRDTSATACAACGILEMSYHLKGEEQAHYYQAAEKMVKSLYENYGNFGNDAEQGLLGGGTFNLPQGYGIGISLIYGDYYFTEAIDRIRNYPTLPSTENVSESSHAYAV